LKEVIRENNKSFNYFSVTLTVLYFMIFMPRGEKR